MGKMMKKLKLYFDSSSISALEQDSKPERMADMQALWEMVKQGDYDAVISNALTIELNKIKDIKKREMLFYRLTEINAEFVEITEKVKEITQIIIQSGILTENNYEDCTHIGCAMVSGCDIIVSYNIKHMVNIRVIRGVRRISFIEGYGDIDIMTAEALINKGDE